MNTEPSTTALNASGYIVKAPSLGQLTFLVVMSMIICYVKVT